MQYRFLKKLCPALLGLALVLTMFGCKADPAREKPGILYRNSMAAGVYRQAFPDHRLVCNSERRSNPYSLPGRGWCVEAASAACAPALEQHIVRFFTPLYTVTPVIAVDRDQTDFTPSGWQDLKTFSGPVAWEQDDVWRRCIFASIGFGLEGEAYQKNTVIDFLRSLPDLSSRTEDAPVLLCMDCQAVDLIRRGRNLELFVPREGTFSFRTGLLSNVPLPEISREALLEAGLRLPDGTSTDPAYPADYSAARELTDPEHFSHVTWDFTRNMRRRVLGERLLSPADSQENNLCLVAASMILLIWAASALHRSTRRDLSRCILAIAFLSISWLMLSMLKYQLDISVVERLCWYAYYIPLMGLPLTLLYVSAVVDKPWPGTPMPRWFVPFLVLYPILVGLVFTNNFHQLVFRFDQGDNWSEHYSYGVGYFLIFGYCIVMFLAALVMLIVKSRKSPRRFACTGPVFVAVLLVGYNLGYALQIPIIRDTNLSLVFCILTVLFLESVLHAGLVPTNTRYRRLFSSSPLNMQLIDGNGKTVLAAANASRLQPRQRLSIRLSPGTPLQLDEDTLLHSRAIHGGYALWEEDLSALNRLRRETEASVRKLQNANALLHQENSIRRQSLQAQVKARLFEDLEKDVAGKTAALSRAIRELPQAPDRRQALSCITLLLCHIKRRCNLFFLAREGHTMSGDELAVYLDELSEFATYAGIHALARCGSLGTLEVRQATLCYDFYFSMLNWSVTRSHATLIGQLERKNGSLVFSILPSEDPADAEFSPAFRQTCQDLGARICRRDLEDTGGLTLSIPESGGDTP